MLFIVAFFKHIKRQLINRLECPTESSRFSSLIYSLQCCNVILHLIICFQFPYSYYIWVQYAHLRAKWQSTVFHSASSSNAVSICYMQSLFHLHWLFIIQQFSYRVRIYWFFVEPFDHCIASCCRLFLKHVVMIIPALSTSPTTILAPYSDSVWSF